MTGPDHFRRAEELLSDQYTAPDCQGLVVEDPYMPMIALAQVHATLALTAATAMQGTGPNNSYDPAWQEVCES